MPINERSEEQREIERMEEWQDREYYSQQVKDQHAHEYSLAKLRYATQPRHKAVARIFIAFAKLPALTVYALILPLLVLKGKEIPKPFTDFLVL